MDKSIFIMNTPPCCGMCEMSGTSVCRKWNRKDVKTFPKDCPLRKFPKKKEYDPAMPVTKQWGYEFTNGYNYCIDEILKEVFENPTEYNGDNIGGRD